jgi:hypothetical protein
MPTLDGPTRPIVSALLPVPLGRTTGYTLAGFSAVALWAATISVTLATRPEADLLIPAAFSVAVTLSIGVAAWGCSLSIRRRSDDRCRAVQFILSEATTAIAENRALLEQITAKMDRDDWHAYAEALKDLTGDDAQEGHVVPIGRARVKRDN